MACPGITKELYGHTKDSKDVYMFTLTAGQTTVRVLNFGCVVKDILVPDRQGHVNDVVLGYKSMQEYETNEAFQGCITGRVSNRINGATFTLDGHEYDVSKNDPLGNNMCHGGFLGLSRRYFNWSIDGSKLVLTYVDQDGAEGFPGDVDITVTYELTEENGLMMNYKATTNKPTPIDISNHFMFNLAGHAAGHVGEHVISVNAEQKLDFGANFIPSGEKSNVSGTVFDLRQPTKLGDVIDKMPAGDGLHIAKVISRDSEGKAQVARVVHPGTGRYMEVSSMCPVVVEYSGHYLQLLLKDSPCKDGAQYVQSGGLLFMPQGYPDAVNQPTFPNSIVRPGEVYNTTTWYKFGVTKD